MGLMSEVRVSDKDQCGDGEKNGSECSISERVGQVASDAAERTRTRHERWPLIWLGVSHCYFGKGIGSKV